MNADDFRRLGHALVNWIADYREGIADLPVMSTVRPGEIRDCIPDAPPNKSDGLETLIEDLDKLVMPGITHWNHPAFFAYFPSNSSFASVLAEFAAAGIGAQAMSWQTSPAAAEMEEKMMEWLRQMAGLPPSFTGVIQDAASTASLVALICARERASGYTQEQAGFQCTKVPLTVYISEQAHSSADKAARLAGFGQANVRAIATDADYAMRADALREAIARDIEAGVKPCAVIATAGTTATTAMDPLAEISDSAAEHGMWMHVDAAMAGNAMILPECRPLFAGIERADSIVWNPHKWLGVTFDLSAYYVRDPALLVRVMATNPSYLRTSEDGRVRNLRDWGIPLGRRFRALKFWLLLRAEGVAGLQARLRRDLDNAQWLAEQVDAAEDWERVAPVPFQTVCVRHVPQGMNEKETNAHNLAWAERINRSGKAYLTPTLLGGRQIVRVSIGAEPTERRDVEALWALMQGEAEAGPR